MNLLPPLHLHSLSVSDFCSPSVFQKNRELILPHLSQEKKIRQIFLNHHCQILFESSFLVWFQIQEMLRVEPNASLQEELQVYQPLIPSPQRITFTLMFEFENVEERHQKLKALIDFQKRLTLRFGQQEIAAQALDEECSLLKASAVNFLFFPLSSSQIQEFSGTKTAEIILKHPACKGSVALSAPLLQSLQKERV
jgi:hypothetical protein